MSDANRRGFLRSSCRHCLGLSAMLGLPALAQDALAPGERPAVPPRSARPAADTDEGGLWSLMDREEVRMRRSPLAIRDPDLGRYLANVTGGLADGHGPDIRVHVVRMPLFNAAAA